MQCAKMNLLGDLPIGVNGVLSIKEEVEFSETQLQEQIFDGYEVKYHDDTLSEKWTEVNGLYRESRHGEFVLNDCEAKTETNIERIKEQPYEWNLGAEDAANTIRTSDGIIESRRKNHSCSVCGKTFRSRYFLDIHMNSHTNSRPYACTICPKTYRDPGNLRRHKLIHDSSSGANTRPSYKCTLCEKSYRSKNNLNSHIRFHRGERPFKCESCPKSYTSPETLRSHIKTHSDERAYECTLCSKKFICDSKRRRHEKTHSNDRLYYQCDVCTKHFRFEDQFRSHSEDNKCKGRHTTEMPFQCSKCDNESFASSELLDRHNAEIHSPPKKNYSCSVCAKAYNRRYLLEIHMNSHTGSRPYACAICTKRFAWPGNLHQHMLTHDSISAEEKKRYNFQCTICEKFYHARSRLNSHMNFHRGERPFKCEICAKSFMSKGQLSSHIKTHSDERRHECTLCSKKFIYDSKRRTHEKTHTNDRLHYHCDICKKHFALKGQYRSHLEGNKCKGKSQESSGVRENEKCEAQIQSQNEFGNSETDERSQRGDAYEKKYKCKECNKQFICKRNFKFHLRSHAHISAT